VHLPTWQCLTRTAIPRERIATRFATQSSRIEYLVTVDALPPWTCWCVTAIEIDMAKDPIKSNLSGHPIKVVVKAATHSTISDLPMYLQCSWHF
jgi:hypothetical protein